MGIGATFAALQSTLEWLTVTKDGGFPPYRLNTDGTPINPQQRASNANETASIYNIRENLYIAPDKSTIAYA